MVNEHEGIDENLILASEEYPPEQFSQYHTFSSYEEKLIRKLIAHGPVLIKGGRGSGKSALLIEACRRLRHFFNESTFGVYVSLRYLPLLRSEGTQYENYFCSWLSQSINNELVKQNIDITFEYSKSISSLQLTLNDLALELNKRIVLLFDDAAHIGRETPLNEFFDIFRCLSTDKISCKAAIYPGVTKFGTRFDVYNDSTVIDIIRDERSSSFTDFFSQVIRTRAPALSKQGIFSESITPEQFSQILGRSVLGNMRAFVFACRWFTDIAGTIGFPEITRGLLHLASEYFWPLLDEVAPKLGPYEPLVGPTQRLGEIIFDLCGPKNATHIIIHKEIIAKYSKLFEILEYAGFLSRREVSKAMKSGGRGSVFANNLSTLLEKTPGTRVTSELMREWENDSRDPAEIHSKSTVLNKIELPPTSQTGKLSIFDKQITILAKSKIYPYGLTTRKIDDLTEHGYTTVGKLADATNDELDRIDGIGGKTIKRIQNVLHQAIWM
jgi:hypothetical protein